MKRFLMITLAALMLLSTVGCAPLLLLFKGSKKTETTSQTETKTEQAATKATEKPTAEPTKEPEPEPTEEPAPEPTEEPAQEPAEEPAAEENGYLSTTFDFYVQINNPDFQGQDGATGVTFKDVDDTYGTTQIAWYSIDAGAAFDTAGVDSMVVNVITAWQQSYGETAVNVLTEIEDIDVNGYQGRTQDAEVNYMGFTLKAKVVIWVAGTRLYLVQMIGLEDGYNAAAPVLQGMLDTFETAADYQKRVG